MEEQKEEIDEDGANDYMVMDDCELYIVYDNKDKVYHAYLQVYNYQLNTCMVMPLKRIGTDPIILGQMVHNELRLLIPALDKQFMQVDESLEVIVHDSVISANDKIDIQSMEELKHKAENNKVFMVLGHNTIQ